MAKDHDYVAIIHGTNHQHNTMARRAIAFQQWLQAKVDNEYAHALEQIEHTPHRASWRAFHPGAGEHLSAGDLSLCKEWENGCDLFPHPGRTVSSPSPNRKLSVTGEQIVHEPLCPNYQREFLAQEPVIFTGL